VAFARIAVRNAVRAPTDRADVGCRGTPPLQASMVAPACEVTVPARSHRGGLHGDGGPAECCGKLAFCARLAWCAILAMPGREV